MEKPSLKYHLLALAVVAVWGITFVSTKVLIGAGMQPAAIFVCRFILAYIGLWIYIILARKPYQIWKGWKDELVFLILGITGGSLLVCFLVWNLVIDKLGNITSTNYVYLNPIFTLLSAMALLGERMTLWAAVGSIAILAGVIWAGKH